MIPIECKIVFNLYSSIGNKLCFLITLLHTVQYRCSHMLPLTVPTGPPHDVTLMDTDPAMLSVSYRPPEESLHNGDVTGYVIRYTRVGSGVSQMIIVNSSSAGLRTSVIPGLLAFTNYLVEVAAVNANGTGPFSDPVTGLSGQDSKKTFWSITCQYFFFIGPAAVPCSLTAENVQSTFVKLSWMSPCTPNGIIIQYEVQYSVNRTTSLINLTDTLMGTVEELSPSTIYTILIRAYTRVGAGPFSNSITIMTLSPREFIIRHVHVIYLINFMQHLNLFLGSLPNLYHPLC